MHSCRRCSAHSFEVKAFAHTWSFDGSSGAEQRANASLYDHDHVHVAVDDQRPFRDEMASRFPALTELRSRSSSLPAHDSRARPDSTLCGLESQRRCLALVRAHTNATGWVPDLLVFLRPDVQLNTGLPAAMLQNMRTDEVLVPHHMAFGGCNDRIGVCCAHGHAADAYGQRVDGVDEYFSGPGRPELLHPEMYLQHTLEANRLHVRPFGIKMSIVLPGGVARRYY
jgi:hypothetical protein